MNQMNQMDQMNEMNQMNQMQDDEIDLFELFQTLWDGKWLISAFVAIAVLLGGGFLLLTDAVYQTKIFLSVDSSVPLDRKQITLKPFKYKVSTDFQKKFYSVSVFEDWKKSNGNVSLVFEDFTDTEVVDGFVLSKAEGKRLATLASKKKGDSFVLFVLIKSKQLSILDEFFKYAQHINELLKNEYVARSRDELKIIESRFKDLSSAGGSIIQSVLSIDRYIVSAEKGANVFTIQRPTKPKNLSPKPSLILALSVVLGGLVGVFFTLVRNAIKKRKEQLAKA